MLSAQDAVLIVIDIQGRLAGLMHEREALFENAGRMIRGAGVLGIPVVWCEQNPGGLGPTVPQVADLMSGAEPIAKMSFSCCGEERVTARLDELARRQVLLTGIETHVCVYQTAVDLTAAGYGVQVVADAVSSRSPVNRDVALRKMAAEGHARITTVEMALFEMLGSCEHERFRDIVRIVK